MKRHGVSPGGKKHYRCSGRGRTFLANYSNRASDPPVREQIARMALNGSGGRDPSHHLRISPSTVCLHLT